MASILQFRPLFRESLSRIRARINADANAGLAPADPSYLDTTPGGFFWDLTQSPALEIARLWDALNEMAASVFPAYSWGIYLDEHGVTLNTPRKDAVAATGSVTFTGTVGTLIPTGVEVATEQVDPDVDPTFFRTVDSEVIPIGGTVDVQVQAVEKGSLGNVAAGTVSVLYSPVDGVASITNLQPVSGGTDIETDEQYRRRILLAYAGAHGAGTRADYEMWALAYPGVSYVYVDPLWNGAGTVRVVVTDVYNKPVSQSVVDGLQAELDPYKAIAHLTAGITFPVANISIDDVTSFLAFGDAQIGSTKFSYTGKSSSQLTGVSGGAGTFVTGTEVKQSGLGHGKAPIGAIVTIATPASVTINVTATIVPETGYSLTGAGGTIPLGDDIVAAITDYIGSLGPADSVVLNAVKARIMDVQGVFDVSALQLNGAGLNISMTPLQVAQIGAVTLT